jgi:hypothetical protein
VPRFLRVGSGADADRLPAGSSIQVLFQAAPADAAGLADEAHPIGGWTANPADLAHPDASWVRFEVRFDVGAGLAATEGAPMPSLDFLRLPFRF